MESTLLGYAVTFIVGGGLAELFRSFRESRKLKAEARALEVSTDTAEGRAEVETLVVIIDNLRRDNETVRGERDSYRVERDDYWNRLRDAEVRIERLQAELTAIQRELQTFMDARPPSD